MISKLANQTLGWPQLTLRQKRRQINPYELFSTISQYIFTSYGNFPCTWSHLTLNKWFSVVTARVIVCGLPFWLPYMVSFYYCEWPSSIPQSITVLCDIHKSIITKYGSTLYIGMDEVLAHYAGTFKNSNLHFHFQ